MTNVSLSPVTWRAWLALRPLDRIAAEWATRTRDVFTVQGIPTRSILIGEVPFGISPLWLSDFLDLPGGDVTASVQLTPYGLGEAKRLLKMRRTQHLTEMIHRAASGFVDDPSDAAALQSATMIEAQVEHGYAKLFRTAVLLTLRAPTVRALADLEAAVLARCTMIGATAWPLTLEHDAGFNAGMPLFDRRLSTGREQTLDTTSIAYSFLYDATNVGMPAGPVWGYTVRRRRAVMYDQWNRALGVEAPHVAIIAPTGTGKSVAFFGCLVEQLVGSGPRPDQVVLIDPKKDYARACAAFGGVRVEWKVGTPDVVINAMQLYAGRHFDQQLQDVLGLLALATTTPTHPMSPEVYSIWEAALRATYARYGIERDRDDTWLFLEDGTPRTPEDYPTLRDLYTTVATVGGEWDHPSLAGLLRPWAIGMYGGIFGRHSTVNLSSSHFVVFDLESLTHNEDALERLRPMATYVIALWVWGEARSNRKRRLLGTDEVATLLAQPATALFFGNLLALGRSYGLSVWHMSQGYTDYTSSPQGRRAIANTPTILLLKQKGGQNMDELRRDFRLNDETVTFLLGALRGVPGKWGSQALMVSPRGQERIEILPPAEVLALMGPASDAGTVVEVAKRVAAAVD